MTTDEGRPDAGITRPKLKLFHLISDAGSAQVRKFIGDQGLADRVEFANVGVGTRDLSELQQFSVNAPVPVLRAYTPTGDLWIAGASNIIQWLGENVQSGR